MQKVSKTPIIDEIRKDIPHSSYKVNIPILSIPQNLEMYGVDLDPDYQRGYVWSRKQQELFVGSLIQNPMGIPKFILNFTGKNNATSEIVDGKQRINALLRWINGEIFAVTGSGITFQLSDLSDVEKRDLRIGTSIEWYFVQLSRIEVMKYYLALNSGGSVHEESELEKVRNLIKSSYITP